MHIKDANQLLDAFYLPFESGWKRLDTGVINIAVRTHMIGCTPAMIDWWIGFLHHSEEYRWWHPRTYPLSALPSRIVAILLAYQKLSSLISVAFDTPHPALQPKGRSQDKTKTAALRERWNRGRGAK